MVDKSATYPINNGPTAPPIGDIIKKEGEDAIISDPETHAHFAEEVCDVLMHLTDMLICLKITPEEVAESFRNKQKRNLRRWKDD